MIVFSGTRLRMAMVKAGYDPATGGVSKVAEAVGVSRQAVHYWLNDANELSGRNLHQLTGLLGIEAGYLFISDKKGAK
jgi:transcriptional regulator with XRE-family HTH domain